MFEPSEEFAFGDGELLTNPGVNEAKTPDAQRSISVMMRVLRTEMRFSRINQPGHTAYIEVYQYKEWTREATEGYFTMPDAWMNDGAAFGEPLKPCRGTTYQISMQGALTSVSSAPKRGSEFMPTDLQSSSHK